LRLFDSVSKLLESFKSPWNYVFSHHPTPFQMTCQILQLVKVSLQIIGSQFAKLTKAAQILSCALLLSSKLFVSLVIESHSVKLAKMA